MQSGALPHRLLEINFRAFCRTDKILDDGRMEDLIAPMST